MLPTATLEERPEGAIGAWLRHLMSGAERLEELRLSAERCDRDSG
jgi:hypothetical protein